MKFTNNTKIESSGSGFVGELNTTYDELVAVFGKPTFSDVCNKVTVQWVLEFEDGTVATIYDYKMDETPKGIYAWHIGGFSATAAVRVHAAFEKAKQQ